MNQKNTYATALSKEDEQKISKIHDLLENGRPKKAAKLILEMRSKFFKNLADYRPMFQIMRKLKKSGCELTFSFLHHCGDKTIVNFVKDLKSAETESEIECLFMTVEGGCNCPRSQDVRIRHTDLFTHYLEALYVSVEEVAEKVA